MKIVDVEEVYQIEKELKKEHVLQLMEWVEKQPHLPKFSGKYCKNLLCMYIFMSFLLNVIIYSVRKKFSMPNLFVAGFCTS